MITRGLTPRLQIEEFRLQIGIREPLSSTCARVSDDLVVNIPKNHRRFSDVYIQEVFRNLRLRFI